MIFRQEFYSVPKLSFQVPVTALYQIPEHRERSAVFLRTPATFPDLADTVDPFLPVGKNLTVALIKFMAVLALDNEVDFRRLYLLVFPFVDAGHTKQFDFFGFEDFSVIKSDELNNWIFTFSSDSVRRNEISINCISLILPSGSCFLINAKIQEKVKINIFAISTI